MLEIKALTYNDLPPVVPISGVLPQEGGTIGRGAQNAIVLPDPMRLISRQHLQILPEAEGQYRVVNISSANLVYINSEELQPGAACVVAIGDKIYVGGYALLLASHASDEFSESPFSAVPVVKTSPEAVSHTLSDSGTNEISPQYSGATQAEKNNPSDDFLSAWLANTNEDKNEAYLPEGLKSERNPIPSDDSLDVLMHPSTLVNQDPMSNLMREGVDLPSLVGKGDALINSADPRDRSLELLQEPNDIIDTIDALTGGHSVDPLALFDLTAPAGSLLDGLEADPVSSNSPHSVAVASSINHGSDLGGLFYPPELVHRGAEPTGETRQENTILPDDFDAFLRPLEAENTAATKPERISFAEDFQSPSAPSSAQQTLSSIDEELHQTATPSSATATPSQPMLQPSEIHALRTEQSTTRLTAPAFGASEKSVDLPQTEPVSMAKEASAETTFLAGGEHEAQLYQALLKGLGLKEIPSRHQLDTNFMYLIGQLLRSTSQGTVDLMAGRAVIKREVKANVTLIAPERNNPLKFSPDGEVALMYLLGRTYPGFMQPAEAMDSAYLDLRAHQIGMVSGMRSALGHVLDKFNPENINNGTVKAGVFSSLGRKAKLWDAYGHYFQTMRDEAEERFQVFFGAAFLKAYEEATASLQRAEPLQENERDAE